MNKTKTPLTFEEALPHFRKVAVFRAGDYGAKGAFSISDLDAMVSAYDPGKAHKAPQSIDHQQFGRAVGWVKSVHREGDLLFADLTENLSPEFAQDVISGGFRKISIELYRQFGEGGGPYLKAVSWLGVKAPEVKGLPEITFGDEASVSIDFDAGSLAEQGVFVFAEGGAGSKKEAEGKRGEVVFGKGPGESRVIPFGEAPPSPDPSAHGVIVYQGVSWTVLEHQHAVYLDAQGNGYTGYPMFWDDARGYVVNRDGHVHQVVNGAIIAGGDPPHSHQLDTVNLPETEMAEGNEAAMDPKTQKNTPKFGEGGEPKPVKPSPAPRAGEEGGGGSPSQPPATFAESAEARRMRADMTRLGEKSLKASVSAQASEFSQRLYQAGVLASADERVKVEDIFVELSPYGQYLKFKEALSATEMSEQAQYNVLTAFRESAESNVETFAEGGDAAKGTSLGKFQAFMESRRAVFAKGALMPDAARGEKRFAGDDPHGAERTRKAKQIAKERDISFSDALHEVAMAEAGE